jgi:LCP family protein required for cell wall assembly
MSTSSNRGRAADVDAHGGDGDGPRRRTRRQRLVLTLGAAASIVLLAGVGVVGYTYWRLGQISRYDVDTSEAVDDEPVNYLVVGSDSRDVVDEDDPDADRFIDEDTVEGGRRADVIMVVRSHPAGDRVEILSIHRDLWVPIEPDGGVDRINTAYGGEEGAQQLIDTIEANLDIPIHHYAEIDFRGFQDLVEAVDGVPMYFDTAYRDDNSGLLVAGEGCMMLDGEQALAFVRSRHLEYQDEDGTWDTDPTGDHGRISRQQVFMRNALSRARGKAQITNPREYNELIDVAVDHVYLSSGVEVTKLAATAQRFAEFEGDTIETYVLPVEDYETPGGALVVRLDEAAAQPVLNTFRGLDPDDVAPAMADLVVLNGSGQKDQAADTEEAFEAIDFRVTDIGDVPGGAISRTRVRYAPGNEVLASLVERHLTAGADLVEDDTLSGFEIVLETGTDFTTVEQEARRAPSTTTTAATTEDRAGSGDAGAESTSTIPATTTTSTTIVGKVAGEVPEGVECG